MRLWRLRRALVPLKKNPASDIVMAQNHKPRRSVEAAIWLTLALVVAILLGARFGWLGLILGGVVAAVAFIGFCNSTTDPEIESLRASLRVARDDIEQVLGEYDDLLQGPSTDALADRTLHYPELANPHSRLAEVQDFHLRRSSAKRFLARVDTHLLSDDLDRTSLERMLSIADQRAADLAESWTDARRAARDYGPA